MGFGDGFVRGVEKVVDHGPDTLRFNIALLSEGYTEGEMLQWQADAQSFVDVLFRTAPFSEPELQAGINVHRVDVVSNESGADNPECGGLGDGSTAATYFDATFCGYGGVHRTLMVEEFTASLTQLAHVPFAHVALVIVNSPLWGGTGGPIPVHSNSRDPDEVSTWELGLIHELAHTVFGLADEYPTYAGCDSGEVGHDDYSGPEPDEPNITSVANRFYIKWGSLIDSSTSIPTMTNDDCAECDPRTQSTEADGTVGAFEGAGYFHCGLYRPEFECRMRNDVDHFCAVCTGVFTQMLAPFSQPTSVALEGTTVTFADVEEGTVVAGAVAFAVDSWLDLSFWVADWPHRLDGGDAEFGGEPILDLPYGRVAESAGHGPRTAYVWITYRATTPGDSLIGAVTVDCDQTGQSFSLLVTANTVERKTVGVMLSLDKSQSMTFPASGSPTKGEALQDAAEVFLDVLPDDDGVGVNSFATDAEYGTGPPEVAGGVFGPGRSAARQYIRSDYEPILVAEPAGLTSIGDAIEECNSKLTGSFDEFAMVIFTDGMETAPKWISDVAGLISSNPRIFAVGLGTPEHLDPATLATICSGSGGELLLTGTDDTDTWMLLSKYFLNILAGVTNTEIVRDPQGYLAPGAGTVRIAFELNETDTSADVVLVTPVPSAVRFALETPAGDIINPTTVLPGTTHVRGARNAFYRVSLPALVDGLLTRDGTWHALLSLDMDDWTAGDNAPQLFWYLQHHPSAAVNGLPYALHVQARSNLKLVAHCLQDSYEPGADLRVRGILSEYGLPVDGRATVRAELTRPDGTAAILAMPEIEPGVFEALEPAHQSGLYRFRVLASGVTLRDTAFTREQLVSGFTYHGGDDPPVHPDLSDRDDCCRLLECLIGALSPQACERLGIDYQRLQRCLRRSCNRDGITTSLEPADIDPADIDLIRTLAAKLGVTSD